LKKLKTAIVHDWFAGYAGSERCVESFTNLYPDADVFVLFNFLNDEEQKIVVKNKKPQTSFIQKLPFARRNHRNYLPLFPYAIEQFDLSEYDLIISSSHAVAKGVLTNQNQLHICYCHTPIRYAWDLTHQYLKESKLTSGIKGIIAKWVLHYIRMWDFSTGNRPDFFIANSEYIAKRIRKIYNRESIVINPPVDLKNFEFSAKKDDFYLTASRFVPYKRIDIIAEAFSKMPDKKLVIVGSGPDEDKIKRKSGSNIEFTGYLNGEKYKDYMKRAKGFVFAAEEDFGIVVIEALASGTPVIALNKGGTAETIKDGINGIHFSEQSADQIIEAVQRFERTRSDFDSIKIAEGVIQYDRKKFEEKIKHFVTDKLNNFYK
jgi:glycosyltransferase involved in cell wall biosynthesis